MGKNLMSERFIDPRISLITDAIMRASCPSREGPYGGYNYDGKLVIRDFRDPSSENWGKWVFQTEDDEEFKKQFKQMTDEHIALVIINALETLNS